jgi:hypothetical protein
MGFFQEKKYNLWVFKEFTAIAQGLVEREIQSKRNSISSSAQQQFNLIF